MPNIASKMTQHRPTWGQHRPNIGQHRPNIGQHRLNIGLTWAPDVPNIDHMGPTWPNLGPRCAPDSCRRPAVRRKPLNNSFGPILVKQAWYALLFPQEQAALSMIFVGIGIAICSATLFSSKPGHRDEPRPRQGQEEDKTRTQSRATDRGAAKTRAKVGEEEDKARIQSRAIQPSHRVQGRTRPGHRAGPYSPATEFRGAASECGQLFSF